MERLVVYTYWPWGGHSPKYRKGKLKNRKSILVSSSAGPSFIGRFAFGSLRQLKVTSKTIGAKPVATIFKGQVAKTRVPKLSKKTIQEIKLKSKLLVHEMNNA